MLRNANLEGCHTKANGFPPPRVYMGDYFLSGLYLLTNDPSGSGLLPPVQFSRSLRHGNSVTTIR